MHIKNENHCHSLDGLKWSCIVPSIKYRENVDLLDIKILSALNIDGRMSKSQLSVEVFLSASPCWERMKKLERNGIIKGYHAAIDLKALAGVCYSRVEIDIHQFTLAKGLLFEKFIKSIPEIIECESILGNVDYILKVLYHNLENYQQTIENLHLNSGVDFSHKTFPVAKIIKEPHQLDIQLIYQNFLLNE